MRSFREKDVGNVACFRLRGMMQTKYILTRSSPIDAHLDDVMTCCNVVPPAGHSSHLRLLSGLGLRRERRSFAGYRADHTEHGTMVGYSMCKNGHDSMHERRY